MTDANGLDLVFALSGAAPAGSRTAVVRAAAFLVAWTEAESPDAEELRIETEHEYMVLLPDTGAVLEHGGVRTEAPGRSICIVPGGPSSVRALAAGRVVRLFAPIPAQWNDVAMPTALHGSPAVKPVLPAFRRSEAGATVRVHSLDLLPNSPGMPRAKQVQSATMSVGWVEYLGPRDRSALSPHNHQDFEQGSLAIEGDFVQHLRLPWGSDADAWRPDRHLMSGPGTVTLIPPPVIHTTEGVGAGRHILIDIFAPPRRDFIAKGQMLNAADYVDPLAT